MAPFSRSNQFIGVPLGAPWILHRARKGALGNAIDVARGISSSSPHSTWLAAAGLCYVGALRCKP